MTNSIQTAAYEYLIRGISIIPVCRKTKKPYFSWKEYQERLPTEAEIASWFAKWPDTNIAIITGKLSKVIVVDVDGEKGKETARLLALSLSPMCFTGKGYHIYYKYPDGVDISNFQCRKDLPGIDLRAEGGYVVAPPSIHANGNQYKWYKSFDEVPLAEFPQGIIHARTEIVVSDNNTNDLGELEKKGAFEGCRNMALARLVGKWIYEGKDDKKCLELAKEWNEKNNPPLGGDEVETTVRSIWKKAGQAFENQIICATTDAGNAERLIHKYGKNIRYCTDWKKWVIWNGKKWEVDDQDRIVPMAVNAVREIYKEALATDDKDMHSNLFKWSKTSESLPKINAMISLAKSIPSVPIKAEEFDSNPWFLNCLNGTIDLKTGELKPHNREDLITKMITVEYDKSASCEYWLRFLEKITNGNYDLVEFLQRAAGYSLTGCTDEQCLFLLYGIGANGKSTFINAINELFGNYSQTASFETFLIKNQDRINNDIARMQGKRFISAIEAEGERRLSESTVKQLTGQDTVTARFLFAEFFEFRPQFKIWLACNHKPIIKGTDHAIWRRIKLIPFTVTINENEKDRDLPKKLKAELPGILMWCIQGCLDWQRKGLKAPKEVEQAVEGYQTEMDVVQGFFDDRCIIKPEAPEVKIISGVLYEAYREWCEKTGEYPLNNRSFGKRLSERGLKSGKSGGKNWWYGIGLTSNN